MSNDLIWIEDFRPRTIEESILPERIKHSLRKMVDNKNIQNYAAVGLPGSGKTSSARAMCEQLGIDYLMINMSNESGIDTVRSKIVSFASTMSFTSDYKVIILDEFDNSTAAAQSALRGIIEEHLENCRFIITANFKNKIMDPIFSRCPIIDFTFTNEERIEMLKTFIVRVKSILTQNEIIFDTPDLIKFCKQNFPDFRKTLNILQMNSSDGELKFSSLGAYANEKISILIDMMKVQNFDGIREWVVNNAQANDGHLIRRAIYDRIKDYVDPESISSMVLMLNQYDARESQVVDKEINMVAFLYDSACNITFKG